MSALTNRSGTIPEIFGNRSRPRVCARIREHGTREQGSGISGHHLLTPYVARAQSQPMNDPATTGGSR